MAGPEKLYIKKDGRYEPVPYLVQLDVAHALFAQLRIREHDLTRPGINADQFNYELKTIARLSSFMIESGLHQDIESYVDKVKDMMEDDVG